MKDVDYHQQVVDAAGVVRERIGEIPAMAIVLGSGLGGFTSAVQDPVSIPYAEVPHWPVPNVAGHDGRLVVGTIRGRGVVVLAGRCHLYEGHTPSTVSFGARTLGLLGVQVLILTNAAGGINPHFAQGSVMVIDDHINLTGSNPLTGPNDDRFGPRFPDMSRVYSARLRAAADRAGRATHVPLVHGTYAAVAGPSYETPAEIRYLRTIGADAVGMSTVPEAIVARHMGLEVLGLSCITNAAAGVLQAPIDHADVVAASTRAQGRFTALLEALVELV